VGIDSGQFVGLLLGSAGAVQQQSVSTTAEVKTASSELESCEPQQPHKPKHENLWEGVDLDAGGFEDFPVNAVD
jgi:hypothetical protein